MDSDFSQHGRFALAFAHLAVHTENRPEAVSLAAGDTTHDYVQDILDESAHQWNAFLQHPFPRNLAKGTTPLNGFRHYMIQDATHFEYFYRVRMEALARTGAFSEIQDFAKILPGGLTAVQNGRADCTNKLGVPKDVVENEKKSHQLEEFIELVASVAKNGDYLDSIIALLPGVLGYDILTKELVRDPNTVRNTVYYTLLIEPWSKIPAQKHKKYINTHIASLSEEERKKRWPGWIAHFKKGCEYEADFSNLATPGQFPKYDIVGGGLYTIRSYGRGNAYLVAPTPQSVTTQEAVPHAEGTWRLTNSPNGYSIQNVKQQHFLITDVKEPLQPVYGVSISPEDYQWSINAVEVKGPNGPYTAYQLLVPGRLQYVLDAGNDPVNPRVFVSNNAQISNQFWLLDPVLKE